MIPFKPRLATPIDRSDRDSISATASVNFKTIDCTVEGDGSEVFDYELYLRHDGTANIQMVLNGLTAYSQDYMQGRTSTPSGNNTASVSSIPVLRCDTVAYTSMAKVKITGYVGNKRHIEVFQSGDDGLTFVRVASFYTADTSTEITSISFFCTTTQTVVFTCAGFAVPKLQYNPHAILLSHKTLSAQTADIIYGGVNDTEGVDDLDGDKYDYYLTSAIETVPVFVFVNEDEVSSRVRQILFNSNGGIVSVNDEKTRDGLLLNNGFFHINKEVGRKGLSTSTNNYLVSSQQNSDAHWNSDTSTKMTSLMLRPSASVSGNVQLYAIPKGYNADLTPWTFRQVVDIAGDFSAGYSFEIPSWAMFMKVEDVCVGGAVTSVFNVDFNNLSISNDVQYLDSAISSTTAGFQTNLNGISVQNNISTSSSSSIFSLKSGYNRPCLTNFTFQENKIQLRTLWFKDSSTTFTTAQIKSSNTETITGKLVVSFI